MLKKITAVTAAVTLAASALVGIAAPAQAASKTIYTQCTLGNYPYIAGKLTKSNLKKAEIIS